MIPVPRQIPAASRTESKTKDTIEGFLFCTAMWTHAALIGADNARRKLMRSDAVEQRTVARVKPPVAPRTDALSNLAQMSVPLVTHVNNSLIQQSAPSASHHWGWIVTGATAIVGVGYFVKETVRAYRGVRSLDPGKATEDL